MTRLAIWGKIIRNYLTMPTLSTYCKGGDYWSSKLRDLTWSKESDNEYYIQNHLCLMKTTASLST